MNEENVAFMDMPCLCDCGTWFDLNDGNPCDSCDVIQCEKCIEQPWDICPLCKE